MTNDPTTQEKRLAKPVETLTDEELAVLGQAAGVVVTPYLTDLDEALRDQAQATALRGLLARGIVSPPEDGSPERAAGRMHAEPAEEGRGEVGLMVRQDVLSLLTLRQAAPSVVAVARTGAFAQDFWYAHVVDEYVLLEEVSTDGLHRFALGHTADLPALLAGAALHPAATDGAGEPTTLTATDPATVVDVPPELTERLGATYLRCDVVVVRRGPQAEGAGPGPLTGVFSGPSGTWTLTAEPGSGRVQAGPATTTDVRRRLGALAASATTGTSAAAAYEKGAR